MRKMFSEKQIQELVKNTPKGIESLVDSQGHDRFVEGDITIEEITGITQTYGKWSLSGTHLMIVVAVDIADTTVLTNASILANLDGIPEWIKDKIVPTFSNIVYTQNFSAYASNYTTQTVTVVLQKHSTYGLRLLLGNNVTLTADRTLRVVYDLLIDSD